MRIHTYTEVGKMFAYRNIKKGDIVSRVYKKLLRGAKITDTKMLGISMADYKQGEEVTDITEIGEVDLIERL